MPGKPHWFKLALLPGLVLGSVLTAIGVWAFEPTAVETKDKPEDAKEVKAAKPDEVLQKLLNANVRFVDSKRKISTDTARDGEWREKFAKKQYPQAAILTCADSRAVPEFIFDVHLGSIFTIRNAGNLVTEDGVASLEYAVEHLHLSTIVIMGHTNCGAVAAVNGAGDKELPGNYREFQKRMAGLREEILREKNVTPEFVNRLAALNARQQAALLLKQSEIIQKAVAKKTLVVKAALYDIKTGKVEFLEDK